MRQPVRWIELAAGAAAGTIIFMAVQGYNVLPVLALGALLFLFTQTVPGLRPGSRPHTVAHTGSAGKSLIPRVHFDEVGGQEAAKRELCEALEFIVRRDEVRRMGIRPLRGILLTGPPGTGKTLLAKAAAGYTQSVFLAASGSEFVEMNWM